MNGVLSQTQQRNLSTKYVVQIGVGEIGLDFREHNYPPEAAPGLQRWVEIVGCIPGTATAVAGVRPGRLVAIDDKPMHDQRDVYEVVSGAKKAGKPSLVIDVQDVVRRWQLAVPPPNGDYGLDFELVQFEGLEGQTEEWIKIAGVQGGSIADRAPPTPRTRHVLTQPECLPAGDGIPADGDWFLVSINGCGVRSRDQLRDALIMARDGDSPSIIIGLAKRPWEVPPVPRYHFHPRPPSEPPPTTEENVSYPVMPMPTTQFAPPPVAVPSTAPFRSSGVFSGDTGRSGLPPKGYGREKDPPRSKPQQAPKLVPIPSMHRGTVGVIIDREGSDVFIVLPENLRGIGGGPLRLQSGCRAELHSFDSVDELQFNGRSCTIIACADEAPPPPRSEPIRSLPHDRPVDWVRWLRQRNGASLSFFDDAAPAVARVMTDLHAMPSTLGPFQPASTSTLGEAMQPLPSHRFNRFSSTELMTQHFAKRQSVPQSGFGGARASLPPTVQNNSLMPAQMAAARVASMHSMADGPQLEPPRMGNNDAAATTEGNEAGVHCVAQSEPARIAPAEELRSAFDSVYAARQLSPQDRRLSPPRPGSPLDRRPSPQQLQTDGLPLQTTKLTVHSSSPFRVRIIVPDPSAVPAHMLR